MSHLPERVEIESSPLKMAGLAVAGVAMTTLSALIALGVIPGDSFGLPIGAFAFLFFGLATAVAIWRLFSARGPVVTMDAHGIRDARLGDAVIPWSAVRGISTWRSLSQRFMVLAVDPAAEAQFGSGRFARLLRRANRVLGADGITVTAQGLKTDFPTLLATAEAFWAAANATPRGG